MQRLYVTFENTAIFLEHNFFQTILRVICDAVGDTNFP